MATAPPLTADDLLAMPDDGNRYELLDGEVYQLSLPSLRHQGVSVVLAGGWLMRAQEAGHGFAFAAPVGVVFPDGSKAEPDLVFVLREHRGILADDAIRGVPDFIVEIISPSSRRHDTALKYRIYERNGVPHYWLCDPDAETITAHTLGADGRYRQTAVWGRDDTLVCPLFPEITQPAAELFG
ncbi:MAG TPA: Uma2 family endonuclease [Thermomicrobiales bacterium]|nr:Uma2 family endonuclease [Thermomicrobiales bacterium]